MGNPQHKFKSIHIAGTNGKGSTSHMMASILQEAGYKTGLYTSPHLIDFRERIRLNGQMIPKPYIVEFVTQLKPFIEQNSFSFFEVTVALAFKYFADNEVDIAVIEVGLGGRLDSTNIITPELSIITNISNDHKQILGETLPEIATEKAGIIKKNVPVVISITQPDLAHIFKEKALKEGAEIFFADSNFKIAEERLNKKFRTIEVQKLGSTKNLKYALDLLGTYQLQNVLGVLQAVEILNTNGYNITNSHLKNGLKKVVKNTGLLGRWQQIGNKTLIFCDTGHNFAGISEVLKNISNQKFENLIMVIGFVKDKDVENILKILPKNAYYIFCEANIPRAMASEVLATLALKYNLVGQVVPQVEKAYKTALKEAKNNDMIFVGGSTFVVADLLTYLQK